MNSIRVNDGYTLRGHVPEVPGLHPRVDFTYRPAVRSLGLRYGQARTWEEQEQITAQILCEQVIEYRVDGDPNPYKLKKEDLCGRACFHADIVRTMFEYVMGYDGPDLEGEEKNSSGEPG
jgi:hypothetical protein